jgi:hypothetical protein
MAYTEEHIQATSVVLEDHMGELTVTAVYSPPKQNIKTTVYEHFFQTLGHRFIEGGDYNAKNTYWGSRTTTTKGRELYKAMRKNNEPARSLPRRGIALSGARTIIRH